MTPLLATPETVTTTFPVVAPVGTGTLIELAPQLEGVAAVPLKVTVLVPWLDPKLVPLTHTAAKDLVEKLADLGVPGAQDRPQVSILSNPRSSSALVGEKSDRSLPERPR